MFETEWWKQWRWLSSKRRIEREVNYLAMWSHKAHFLNRLWHMVVCKISILGSVVFRCGRHCDFLWLTALMPQSCSVTNVTRTVRSCQRTLWSRKRSMSLWTFTPFREACSANISSISGPRSFLAPHNLRRAETFWTSSNNSPEYIFKNLANGENVFLIPNFILL